MNTGLPNITGDTGVVFYGNATTAVMPGNCCPVDIVAECP